MFVLRRLVLTMGIAFALNAQGAESGVEFFEKRVRPLLVERCYECHGEKKQKGGLRLDSAAAVAQGGDTGAVIVPGKPEESPLVEAISWRDPDRQMPPKKKLSDDEIATLTAWIKMGAPDPRTGPQAAAAAAAEASLRAHWAYQSPQQRPAPQPKNSTWAHNDIDRFILAKLESRGMEPGVDADRTTLARRVYFDLIGLPPSPEQIAAFVTDQTPDALMRLVDQLLASPQFGERWGRHWLDVARFGESVTLRGLIFKEAWRYRDYVIEAFNRDKPYNDFIREQVAGDLLPTDNLAARRERVIATTFLALGNTNLEEQDKAQLRMDVVDEQIDTIGKGILAQTISCARCHDHKFDPIPTRDYYALAGILRGTKTLVHANVSNWIEVPLPVEPDQEAIFKKHEGEVAALQAQIKAAKDLAKAVAGKSGEPRTTGNVVKPVVVAASELPGVIADSSDAKAVGDWKLSQHSKHYIGDGYFHDDNRDKGKKTLTFIPDLKKPGRYEVRIAYIHSPSRATNVPVTVFHADGETTLQINQQEAPVLDGRFVSLGQYRFEANGFGYVLVATEGTSGHVTADAVQFIPAEMIDLAVKSDNDAGKPAVEPTKIARLEEQLKALQQSGPKRPMVMSVKEEEPGDTEVHIRGSVHSLGGKVPRGFLQAAMKDGPPPMPEKQSGRRELAEWLASPANPLTARVMSNRLWHWLFGSGLVRTTDNFGTMGEAPSHPELLDYLALHFVEQGWSVKKMVREMVLSHTYQLASAQAHNADPGNRLLGHFPRRRLEAECIRDAMLQVGGQLDLTPGGPTIKPDTASDYGYSFTAPRRSIYVPALRNALPEIFEAFDIADPSTVTGVRNTSTVAPQALFLMNHPFVIEQARHAAEKLLGGPATDERVRLETAYRSALGRNPSDSEIELSLKSLGRESDPITAWTQIFHALFASADFRYLN